MEAGILLCISVVFLAYEFWKEGRRHDDWRGMTLMAGIAIVLFIGFLGYKASITESQLTKGVCICSLLALIIVPVIFWFRALEDTGTSKLSDEELEKKGIYPDLDDPRVQDMDIQTFADPALWGSIKQTLLKNIWKQFWVDMTPVLIFSILIILSIIGCACGGTVGMIVLILVLIVACVFMCIILYLCVCDILDHHNKKK